jgi:hypothetical protein
VFVLLCGFAFAGYLLLGWKSFFKIANDALTRVCILEYFRSETLIENQILADGNSSIKQKDWSKYRHQN